MKKIRLVIIGLIFVLLFIGELGAKDKDLDKIESLAKESQNYYEQAINLCKDLIKKKPTKELYLKLAELYFRNAKYEEATQVLENIKDPRAAKFRAIAYYYLGRFNQARENFKEISEYDDQTLYFYALTLERLNLFDEAISIYEKIKDKKLSVQANLRIQELKQHSTFKNIREVSDFIYKKIIQAPSPKNYPEAGALILYCDEKIEVSLERKQVNVLHYLIKILNPRGKEKFSEIHINYDSTFERVELEYARTIKPDGEVINVSPRHIRDVSKYLDFPLYSNVRVFIISFPEVTEGACLEYKLKVYRSELINKKDIVLSYPLQADEPIVEANFTLKVPRDNPCHFKFINLEYLDFKANLEPNIKEDKDYIIYTWNFKDIPQIIPEANMPPSSEINPTILVSTFDSWQEVYSWWWSLAKDKISADNSIKEKVKEITKNKTSLEDKIKAIYNFCAEKIRYVAVEYGEGGYEPHTAEQVFKYKYGDCKDQAVLLVSMLRELGLLSYLVLIPTEESYNLLEDFPTLVFNHCIVALEYGGDLFFLDPTCETCSFGDLPIQDQGRNVLVFKEEGFLITQTPSFLAEHNLISTEFKISFDKENNLLAQREVQTKGFYSQAQRSWLKYTPPQLIKDLLREKIQEFSTGAELEEYRISNLEDLNSNIKLAYSFRGGEFFVKAGDFLIFPSLVEFDSKLVAKEKRKYPLYLGLPYKNILYFEIDLPNGYYLEYLPKGIYEDNAWLRYEIDYRIQGKKIILQQINLFKKKKISLLEYSQFRNFIYKLAKELKERIILRKKK